MNATDYYGALPNGCRLHEYSITKVLGQGGFGITYLARDGNLNKPVAIKEYLPENFALRQGADLIVPKPGSDDDFRWGLDRFLQEAQTLAQFQHPNIVPVLRFFELNGTAYMVMAYQDGESLATILDRHRTLEESELEEILYPLLDGLRHVHEAGILHRDIKPDNIFIRADATPVLLDFGAARQAIGGRGRNVTRIITPNYAPPEQYYSDGHLGPWTDIYALGAVIYEAIAGSPPPEAPARMAQDRIRPAARIGGNHYRSKFLEAIDAALVLANEERPQTISEWLGRFPDPVVPGLSVIRDRAARTMRLQASAAPAGNARPATEEDSRPEAGSDVPGPAPPDADLAVAATRRPDSEPGAGATRVGTFRRQSDGRAPGGGSLRLAVAGSVVFLLVASGAAALLLMGGLDRRDGTGPGDRARLAETANGTRDVIAEVRGMETEGSLGIELPPKGEDPDAEEEVAPDIQRAFLGARAFVQLPGAADLVALEFHSSGRLTSTTGSEEYTGNQTGRWSMRGRRLCMRLTYWNGGESACYDVRFSGGERAGKRAFVGSGVNSSGAIRGELLLR